MNIKIQSNDFILPPVVREEISSKLHLILGRFGQRIRQTEVVLSDVNRPRGGLDKKCIIKLRINQYKVIVSHDTTDDMYDSIAKSAYRARRTMERFFDRKKNVEFETV
ncbi:MAG: putative sigma-54 modulation protein [Paraglaciecola sp.]|jgi:putative sigma-54 modulation protein